MKKIADSLMFKMSLNVKMYQGGGWELPSEYEVERGD